MRASPPGTGGSGGGWFRRSGTDVAGAGTGATAAELAVHEVGDPLPSLGQLLVGLVLAEVALGHALGEALVEVRDHRVDDRLRIDAADRGEISQALTVTQRLPHVIDAHTDRLRRGVEARAVAVQSCLLYTSDAADDLLCVDLGGRRII